MVEVPPPPVLNGPPFATSPTSNHPDATQDSDASGEDDNDNFDATVVPITGGDCGRGVALISGGRLLLERDSSFSQAMQPRAETEYGDMIFQRDIDARAKWLDNALRDKRSSFRKEEEVSAKAITAGVIEVNADGSEGPPTPDILVPVPTVAERIVFFDSVATALGKARDLKPTHMQTITRTFSSDFKCFTEIGKVRELPPMLDWIELDVALQPLDVIISEPHVPLSVVPILTGPSLTASRDGTLSDSTAREVCEAQPDAGQGTAPKPCADEPDTKIENAELDTSNLYEADWTQMAWKSEPAHFSLDDGASSDQSAHASMLDVLSDLVDLEEVGEVVRWPLGWDLHAAKCAVRERPACKAPAAKRARSSWEGEAHASIDDSTIAIASVPAPPDLTAVPLQVGPARMRHAPIPAHAIGSGHKLRASGLLIWCRNCGRYGEDRFRKDGLGGSCRGESVRDPTQYDRLIHGRHPRWNTPLPPDVPDVRRAG